MRKVISNRSMTSQCGRTDNGFYIVSLSCRTIVYKGMFLAAQLGAYYKDLHDPRFESALALVHQRFSTNTFPSWKLAHPYRMVAHNGEINTLRGNVNWMAARQASVDPRRCSATTSPSSGRSPTRASRTPPASTTRSNSCAGGYSLPHAAMMLIPEAWAGNR
jgi:glutamate synthase (NADPH/NADH) large chain